MGLFDALYEYDEEKHLRTIRKEGFEEGRNSLLNLLLADGTLTPERADSLRKMDIK